MREREKGNQSNGSDILLGREPLGEGLIQGHLVGRISSLGDDGTFVPHGVCGSLQQTPSPFLLPDLSIFLPACEKMSAAPGKSGPPCVASLQCLGPACQHLLDSSRHRHSRGGIVPGASPHFPSGEEQFPNARTEYKQKVMDLAVTKQPEAALTDGRMIPHSIRPSPLAPVDKHKFPLDDQVSRVSSSIFFL